MVRGSAAFPRPSFLFLLFVIFSTRIILYVVVTVIEITEVRLPAAERPVRAAHHQYAVDYPVDVQVRARRGGKITDAAKAKRGAARQRIERAVSRSASVPKSDSVTSRWLETSVLVNQGEALEPSL